MNRSIAGRFALKPALSLVQGYEVNTNMTNIIEIDKSWKEENGTCGCATIYVEWSDGVVESDEIVCIKHELESLQQ